MIKVLVTGAKGQLGKCIEIVSEQFPKLECTFVSKSELDISSTTAIAEIFRKDTYDYCINTAAYTHVELAETEIEKAFLINAEGAKNIAEACQENNVTLLHISTDYVFDGTKESPYSEEDQTNPINVYGTSKLQGEKFVSEICSKHYIVRTSWLYSNFGKNFYTTMLRLAEKKTELSITTAEVGTPTNGYDLAETCLKIISEEETMPYGVYHFSNEGEATWYDFAEAIFESHQLLETLSLSKTDFFPTRAKRPAYSVLNKDKMKKANGISAKPWKRSLEDMITTIS